MNSILRNDTQVYFASTTYSPDLIDVEEDQGAGGLGAEARAAAARRADRGRVRTARLRLRLLVRRDGAGRHAGGDPQQGLAPTSRARCKLPDVEKAVDNQGLVVVTQSPAEFDKLIASEASRYGKILRDAGVGAEK